MSVINPSKKYTEKRLSVKTVILRIVLSLVTLLVIAVGGILGAVLIFEYGPSQKARDLFVVSVMETSAAKFLATAFMGQEKVDEILAANAIQSPADNTNMDLVVIGGKDPSVTDPSDNDPTNTNKPTIPGSDGQEVDPDGDGIDIVDVRGTSFKGKMMIVYDPTRVFLGVSGAYGEGAYGKNINEIMARYDNIVGAVNGGGWMDANGNGRGGEPKGPVISEGKLLWGELDDSWECCGITKEGKLYVGRITMREALAMGVENAVRFGPSLVINNEPTTAFGSGSGLNPRTAIGQRADGAILLLAIDGRTASSLGASFVDEQDIMLRFGAVNAYNLDGGSSTSMIYKGEHITESASLLGLRRMPNAFLIRGKEGGE